MKKVKFLSLILVMVFGLSACTYDEGPFLSVVSKTERVANKWVIGKSIKDGVESASQTGFESIEFTKDGDATFVGSLLGVEYTLKGTWAFSEDKAAILLNVSDANNIVKWEETMTILKLKEKELWVTYVEKDLQNKDIVYEVHFIPAES